MKWLKDDSYNAMKQAADNWDKLLNKVLGDNPDMKAEDVTVDQLLDSIIDRPRKVERERHTD